MRVIVTRPAAQAAQWVQLFAQHSIDAVALPLIDIAPAANTACVAATWQDLSRYRLAIFVSANAAQGFFAQKPVSAAWPREVLAGSTGPGTTSALVALGVPKAQIVEPAFDTEQFDSESLWSRLSEREWRNANVLILRGRDGRDWLTQTLRAHGALVEHVATYRRLAPQFSPLGQALLREAVEEPASFVWYFSSSEAIGNLESAVRPANASRWARSRAVATHPRVADRARKMGFGQILQTRPSLAAVVACIQSLEP
jgi:uroporphyrinogen-III synthase